MTTPLIRLHENHPETEHRNSSVKDTAEPHIQDNLTNNIDPGESQEGIICSTSASSIISGVGGFDVYRGCSAGANEQDNNTPTHQSSLTSRFDPEHISRNFCMFDEPSLSHFSLYPIYSTTLESSASSSLCTAVPSNSVPLEPSSQEQLDIDPVELDSMKEYAKVEGAKYPHVQQKYSWDCGLACAEMVLKARGIHDIEFSDLHEVCRTKSVWTIDLAYLMRNYGIEARYYTTSMGVREEYKKQAFYQKHLKEDAVRVQTLFDMAKETGVNVVCRSVSNEWLKALVERNRALVIVLVDNRLLHCVLCNRSGHFFANSLTRLHPGFIGHYVLICGYHADSDSFLIKDPAMSRNACMVKSKNLENARRAFGTDEDLLCLGKVTSGQNMLLQAANMLPSNNNHDTLHWDDPEDDGQATIL